MSELPDPLTPADCDLRGLPFMPLDVVRLTDSDLFALSTGDEFKAAVTLWCKAWLQVPAASLPDDDRILAHLSGAGARWKKIKPMAMRNFVLCSDGRWYHDVIAEKASDAWERREEWQAKQANKTERQRRWRERLKELSAKLRDAGITPPAGASLSTLERLLVDANASTGPSTVDARETALTGTGTGTGTEEAKASLPQAPTPTREPGRPIRFEGKEIPFSDALLRTFKAANIVRTPSTDDQRHLRAWIDAGADLQVDVLDVAARIARRQEEIGKSIGMLKYLDGPVNESIEEGRREREHLREVGERYAHLPKPVAAQGVH